MSIRAAGLHLGCVESFQKIGRTRGGRQGPAIEIECRVRSAVLLKDTRRVQDTAAEIIDANLGTPAEAAKRHSAVHGVDDAAVLIEDRVARPGDVDTWIAICGHAGVQDGRIGTRSGR